MPLSGSSEGAFLVAKKLRGDQRRRDRGTIYPNERAVGPARPLMNGACHQFFTRSALASDQYGRVRWSHSCKMPQNAIEHFRRTYDLLEHAGRGHLLA